MYSGSLGLRIFLKQKFMNNEDIYKPTVEINLLVGFLILFHIITL